MANQANNGIGFLLLKAATQTNANRYSFLRKAIDKRILREVIKRTS